MSAPEALTAERVHELVASNRAIRAPHYESEHDDGVEFADPSRGLQWGADAIPALMDLFRVERRAGGGANGAWTGFARHWRGDAMRLDFDRVSGSGGEEPILVVTAICGRTGGTSIADPDFGEVALPDEVPTQEAWNERVKRYQAARRTDDSDGSAAAEAFMVALPGWRSAVGTRIDEIIRREVPDVRCAVKWHNPFYGVEDRGWFASLASLSRHLKLSLVSGTYLDPKPPKANAPDRQATEIRESDALDEEQIASWIRQAAADPGLAW